MKSLICWRFPGRIDAGKDHVLRIDIESPYGGNNSNSIALSGRETTVLVPPSLWCLAVRSCLVVLLKAFISMATLLWSAHPFDAFACRIHPAP